MSVFKDFPGLENLEKLFQDFQGPTRALSEAWSAFEAWLVTARMSTKQQTENRNNNSMV